MGVLGPALAAAAILAGQSYTLPPHASVPNVLQQHGHRLDATRRGHHPDHHARCGVWTYTLHGGRVAMYWNCTRIVRNESRHTIVAEWVP